MGHASYASHMSCGMNNGICIRHQPTSPPAMQADADTEVTDEPTRRP